MTWKVIPAVAGGGFVRCFDSTLPNKGNGEVPTSYVSLDERWLIQKLNSRRWWLLRAVSMTGWQDVGTFPTLTAAKSAVFAEARP